MGLMGIGEFARLSRLSPKALRLYDELGLLPPARVDPDSGYRWYASGQQERASLVASLRQIGMPLARIQAILGADEAVAAEQVGAYWVEAEVEHAARRDLAGYLVDRLNGKRSVMYEVAVRDIPPRSLLSALRHATPDQVFALGKEFMAQRKAGSLPLIEGVAGAPFLIYHGLVSEDSDGPVEFCWPVPDDQAAELAARFPDWTLRTEAAHQEAFVHVGQAKLSEAQLTPVLGGLYAWATEQHRQPTGGIRMILLRNSASTEGPDGEYAVPLR